ncbi:MAG TPA: nucleotidyltransferase domain-containing protein [Bacteroidales bacterium]|nr:nucleotidyltransferase domain-containing protein [Lentimicrobiaceae bacterium]HOH99066.1 nucleotidyltransferase domain-containing protein [Bacteroidales bacterium]
MYIINEISKRESLFGDICKSHSIRNLYAFGSSTSNHFDRLLSDIDLLVEIDDPDPIERGEKLMSLWDLMEDFFQRKVDLLTEGSIRNPFLKRSIDSSKVLIYDGSKQKVLV